ncbi:hypothetical protein MVEG_05475 [Podila verticillata NRRL 6337]|nr:hypothetical protein MVEG_05475 [Podila verticillata NRRL 6337]
MNQTAGERTWSRLFLVKKDPRSSTCLPNGSCGCTGGSSACGNTCCKYGCEGTKCACAPGYSTRCTDTACCPTGSICIGGGLCRGASAPDPPMPSGGSGSGSGSGSGGSGSGLKGAATGTERTFGAVSAMMAMAAIFVAA